MWFLFYDTDLKAVLCKAACLLGCIAQFSLAPAAYFPVVATINRWRQGLNKLLFSFLKFVWKNIKKMCLKNLFFKDLLNSFVALKKCNEHINFIKMITFIPEITFRNKRKRLIEDRSLPSSIIKAL